MSLLPSPAGSVAWRIVRADRSASRWRELPARKVTPADGRGAHIEFAFAQKPPSPEGFAVVPVEPTQAMLSAAIVARDRRIQERAAANGGKFNIGNGDAAGSMADTYRAMVAAAPAPRAEETAHG